MPAWVGAMSLGTAQIGPIVSSRHRNDPDRHSATPAVECTTASGSRHRSAPTKLATITLWRDSAGCRSSGRCGRTQPPSVSPTTPAKNTPDANSAVDFRFRPCVQGVGSHVKNSHAVQP